MKRRFETTRWTLVLNARERETPEAEEALAHLCETYWLPLWFFVRAQGYSSEDARDLTQGYFTRLSEALEHQHLPPESLNLSPE